MVREFQSFRTGYFPANGRRSLFQTIEYPASSLSPRSSDTEQPRIQEQSQRRTALLNYSFESSSSSSSESMCSEEEQSNELVQSTFSVAPICFRQFGVDPRRNTNQPTAPNATASIDFSTPLTPSSLFRTPPTSDVSSSFLRRSIGSFSGPLPLATPPSTPFQLRGLAFSE
eukprot:1918787-Rhodomonas_salina.1